MQIQISVYISLDQAQELENYDNKSKVVREALKLYFQEGDKEMTYIDVKNQEDAEKLSKIIEEVTGAEENPHYPRVPQMDSNRWTAELNIEPDMVEEIRERLDEEGIKYKEVQPCNMTSQQPESW